MVRKLLLASFVIFSAITGCGDDEDDDGSAGRGGAAGRGGSGGKAGTGSGGIAGSAGTGGALAGSGGQAGTGGAGGGAGTSGTGGMDGGAGKGGADGGAGKGGTAGTGGGAGTDGGVPDGSAGSDAGEGGVVDASLRVHLRFDETSGTVANDSSGNGFHGTLHNATWTPGHAGGAVDLLNNDIKNEPPTNKQWVSLPPNILAPCDDVTIALWIRLRSLFPFTRILDLDGGINGFIFLTATADSGRALLFNIFRPVDPGPRDQGVLGAYPAPDAGGTLLNEWHHYAITLNGQVARAYFDGREIGRNENMTFNPSDIGLRPDGGEGGEPHAWLGRSLFGADDPYLNAQLDDLRISCRAYTANEIAQLAD
jgi:hypothetical protein